jgi:hypothetical protein
MRKIRALVLLFAFLVLFAGGFSILSSETAEARYGCCIWVMYCTVEPPIYCWCECVPVPCP